MHGPKKGKIAHKKFDRWLSRRGLQVLGKEFEHRVHSGGWPDFVVKNRRGKIEFYEVKSGNHTLDHHQLTILKLLRKIGKVRVMRLDKTMRRFKDETPPELRTQ